MIGDHGLKGVSGHQRHVSAQDDHLLAFIRHMGKRAHHGVSGSELLFLEGKDHRSGPRHHPANLFGLVSHHHDDVIAGDAASRLDDIHHHGFPQDLMQHLGLRRLHALAEPGSQYDDRDAMIHPPSSSLLPHEKPRGQILGGLPSGETLGHREIRPVKLRQCCDRYSTTLSRINAR